MKIWKSKREFKFFLLEYPEGTEFEEYELENPAYPRDKFAVLAHKNSPQYPFFYMDYKNLEFVREFTPPKKVTVEITEEEREIILNGLKVLLRDNSNDELIKKFDAAK